MSSTRCCSTRRRSPVLLQDDVGLDLDQQRWARQRLHANQRARREILAEKVSATSRERRPQVQRPVHDERGDLRDVRGCRANRVKRRPEVGERLSRLRLEIVSGNAALSGDTDLPRDKLDDVRVPARLVDTFRTDSFERHAGPLSRYCSLRSG